jgi:hypothetical protein
MPHRSRLRLRFAGPLIVGAVGEVVIALITLGLVYGGGHFYYS